MAQTTCCHCDVPGNLRTTEGTRRAGLCEDIFSVTASREVSEDEPRAGGGGGPQPKLAYDVSQSSHFTGSPLSAIRALDRHEQGCAMRGWSGG